MLSPVLGKGTKRKKSNFSSHISSMCFPPSFEEKKTKQTKQKNQHPSLDPSHRHCLFVLCTKKTTTSKHTLYSVGLGLRPVTSFDVCIHVNRWRRSAKRPRSSRRVVEREANCRRREQKESKDTEKERVL